MTSRKPKPSQLEWLYGELPGWVSEGLVSAEAAESIQRKYGPAARRSAASVAVIGLGALGASFIIGGIILMLASNWEALGRGTRAVIAFLPMLVGQAAVAYTLWRKAGSVAWREGSALFLTGAVAACIALIGQTYHLPGSMSSFLWVCLLLAWPLIYVLNASLLAGAALYAALWWAGESDADWEPAMAWVFIAAIVPHVVWAARKNPHGLRFQFLLWCLVPWLYWMPPLFGLWSWDPWTMSTSVLLGSVLLLFGLSPWAGPVWNPGLLAGGISTAVASIVLTKSPFWYDGGWDSSTGDWGLADYSALALRVVLAVAALALLAPQLRRRNLPGVLWGSFGLVVLAVQIMIHLGASAMSFPLLFHAYALALAVLSLREGIRGGGLVLTNVGMALIAAYATLRFMDLDVPFLLRGLLFVLIGVGFLAGNIVLARRARSGGAAQP